jgi:hypothetical protein
MTLRTRLIEAGAASIYAPYPFDDLADEEKAIAVNVATDILDAFLSTLSESADEWNQAAGQYAYEDEWAQTLLAVLQGEPDE